MAADVINEMKFKNVSKEQIIEKITEAIDNREDVKIVWSKHHSCEFHLLVGKFEVFEDNEDAWMNPRIDALLRLED